MNIVVTALVLSNTCMGSWALEVYGKYSTENLEVTTPPPPPKPYSFKYQAGRYPGQIDRVHQEAGDGSGIVHGSYSYIDPKHKVRTVDYVADANGFHPSLTNFEDTLVTPTDSEAVKLAKEKHYALYERIANANAQGIPPHVPADSASVTRAKDKHLQLFQKIAQEHAEIAAQREAERLAFEATSVPNEYSMSVEKHDHAAVGFNHDGRNPACRGRGPPPTRGNGNGGSGSSQTDEQVNGMNAAVNGNS
ncbi:uncharacterized protein LOC107266736 [Cephus cinctus]|uniref:Uncharacterized protein LOC107266736 n=1 Tax=Cephus cinctus TaxID=211228 RepID=A0AAJ7RFZ0_CEPCN|nr:uncharacterized protein LOC107266736 [Cephus cinctus]